MLWSSLSLSCCFQRTVPRPLSYPSFRQAVNDTIRLFKRQTVVSSLSSFTCQPFSSQASYDRKSHDIHNNSLTENLKLYNSHVATLNKVSLPKSHSAHCYRHAQWWNSLVVEDAVDRQKLLVPSALHGKNAGKVFIRAGHHLSRMQHCQHTSTQGSQGSRDRMLRVPATTQLSQTRPINVPKLILDASPTPWQPYLNLIRFDKPIGTWLLYWPCAWSIALAAQPGCWTDFYYIALFGAGAFFMRGAGCIINDMWDKDFDIKVERTKDRPLASDKVTYPQAFAFLGSQLAISLAILLQLNWYSIGLGVASLAIVITYPSFKRFTYWPQIVLGFAFNYGALLGWAAVRGSCDWSICIPLYFMCHMWTMVYDTIYAHQDKSDDILLGVKSTALRFGDQTKPWLAGFTAAMAGGLLYVGHITDMTWPYYTGATITIASILTQLYRLDIDNPQACGDAFRFHFYMGLLMFVSIMLGNRLKPKDKLPELLELNNDTPVAAL